MSIGAPITKSSQQALQADGLTPLAVDGETRLILSRADKHLTLDALVVDDLDVEVIAGTPFLSPTIALFALLSAKCVSKTPRSSTMSIGVIQTLLPMLCDVRKVTLYAHHRLRLSFGLVIT